MLKNHFDEAGNRCSRNVLLSFFFNFVTHGSVLSLYVYRWAVSSHFQRFLWKCRQTAHTNTLTAKHAGPWSILIISKMSFGKKWTISFVRLKSRQQTTKFATKFNFTFNSSWLHTCQPKPPENWIKTMLFCPPLCTFQFCLFNWRVFLLFKLTQSVNIEFLKKNKSKRTHRFNGSIVLMGRG